MAGSSLVATRLGADEDAAGGSAVCACTGRGAACPSSSTNIQANAALEILIDHRPLSWRRAKNFIIMWIPWIGKVGRESIAFAAQGLYRADRKGKQADR